jgi:hypothetical protein
MDSFDTDGLCKIGCTVLHSTMDRFGDIVHVVRTPDGAELALRKSDLAALIDGKSGHNVDPHRSIDGIDC